YLAGAGTQRQGLSALEQSGERLARSGRELELQRQPVNALVKQHEHQIQMEKKRTRYHGLSI
ncbi:relaxase, partial [Salmonella enterica subsp. enterica serovar Typhimurium]|nr:relaxase [Salmonella enterica subsp. enterica serovar Typhimurium]